MESDRTEFVVVAPRPLEEGKTITPEQLDALSQEVRVWLVGKILRAWEKAGEPPTDLRLRVEATLTVDKPVV